MFQSCLTYPNVFYRKVTNCRSAEGFHKPWWWLSVVEMFIVSLCNGKDVPWEITVWKVQIACLLGATGGDLHENPIWVFMRLQVIKRVHLACTFLSSVRVLCSGAVGEARGTIGSCSTPQQQYASPWLYFYLHLLFPELFWMSCPVEGVTRQEGAVFRHFSRTQTEIAFLMQRNSFQQLPQRKLEGGCQG